MEGAVMDSPATPTPRKRGRPRIIGSPEEFERKANAYFAACEAQAKPVLFTGLVLALGLSGKKSFYDYRDREGFTECVNAALLRVEMEYEMALRTGGSTGPIFALKNFGWSDKMHPEHSGPSHIGASQCEAMAQKARTRLEQLRRERK